MSENKQVIEKYIDGFNKSDHAQILSCLTDDVEWIIPNFFHGVGKAAFDREIENDAFTGRPLVTIARMVEENDVVIVEGSVQSSLKDGTPFQAQFCDVFEMQEVKIKRLTSYLVEIK